MCTQSQWTETQWTYNMSKKQTFFVLATRIWGFFVCIEGVIISGQLSQFKMQSRSRIKSQTIGEQNTQSYYPEGQFEEQT